MKKNIWLIVIILIFIIAVVIWLMMDNDESTEDTTNTTTTNTTDEVTTNTSTTEDITNTESDDTETTTTDLGIETDIVSLQKFTSAPSDWYEHVWYKEADAGGEVTYGSNGVTFTGLKSNSRSGIMTDLDFDVTDYLELNLSVSITNTTQTLSGTGWNGREAPVAVAVSYSDADGLKHTSLGEDPTAAGQIFWKGFYTLDPDGSSGTTNGIKVTSGEPYDYEFDLMTLDPKPVTIHYVGLEGAGWQERVGTVHSLKLVGIK